MSRSSWKLNYLPKSFLRSSFLTKPKQIWNRGTIIPSFLLGQLIKIHTGKEFKVIKITEEKIGYKFGEFVTTRKPYMYKGKKKIITKRK